MAEFSLTYYAVGWVVPFQPGRTNRRRHPGATQRRLLAGFRWREARALRRHRDGSPLGRSRITPPRRCGPPDEAGFAAGNRLVRMPLGKGRRLGRRAHVASRGSSRCQTVTEPCGYATYEGAHGAGRGTMLPLIHRKHCRSEVPTLSMPGWTSILPPDDCRLARLAVLRPVWGVPARSARHPV